MKIALLIAFISIGLTSSAQKFTRAQAKKSKILTNFIWQNADSTQSSQAPGQFNFSDEKDFRGYKGSFKLHFRSYGMGWEWADKKATALILYLRYSSTSWDTLRLTNVRVTNKLLTADFAYSWVKSKTGKMRHFPVMTREEANKEPGELKDFELK